MRRVGLAAGAAGGNRRICHHVEEVGLPTQPRHCSPPPGAQVVIRRQYSTENVSEGKSPGYLVEKIDDLNNFNRTSVRQRNK